MNKWQHTTMYIKHLADSTNFKAVTFNKKCSGLTGLFSEMPNVLYTWPLGVIWNNYQFLVLLSKYLNYE